MSIIVGTRVAIDKRVWTVTRVEGNYCYVECKGHAKVVPTLSLRLYVMPGSPGNRKPRPKRAVKKDIVHQALSECETPDDLLRVAENHFNAPFTAAQIATIAGLPNFPMQRMYAGGRIRAAIAGRQFRV